MVAPTNLPGIPYVVDLEPARIHNYRLDVVSKPDGRDYIDPDETRLTAAKLPDISMIEDAYRPLRLDQGQLGSCVPNGTAYQAMIHMLVNGVEPLLVSRLQLYYDARALEGTIGEDSGLDPRDALIVFKKRGVGREDLWPYDISRFTQKPPDTVYADAPNHRIGPYYRVASPHNTQAKLHGRIPVGFAIAVYDGMMRSRNGVIPMPDPSQQLDGYHWITATGYCYRPDWPGGGYYRLDNTWGQRAGDGSGCYFLPFDYAHNSQLTFAKWRFMLPKAG
jgi:hypothetical protein